MNKSLIAIGLAGFALTACDSGVQDGGSDTRVGMNGLVVDGRVAFGKVWVDMNNNNKIDDFEPFAFTDSEGYYSYNPNTPRDYCALDTTDAEYKHCLKYGSSVDSTVIRITGGTDLATGEKLKGVMAMLTTIGASQTKASSPLILSPITTLLESADSEAKRTAIKAALGIENDDDLKLDFSNATDDKTKKLYANAVALQTMVDLLVAGRDEDSDVTDAELQQAVIDEIVDRMSSEDKKLTEFDAADIEEVAKTVISDGTKRGNLGGRIESINSVLVQVETATEADVKALVKTSEVITQLVRKEVQGEDTAAIAKVLGADTTAFNTLRDTLKTGLSAGESFDIRSVTNSLVEEGEKDGAFDPNTVVSDLVAESAISDANIVFAQNWFYLKATADLAQDLTDGSFILIGTGAPNSTFSSGDLHVCVNVTENADDGESFTNEYIGGTWSTLRKNEISLLLNYEGLEFSGIMKAREAFEVITENEVEEETENRLFRFSTELVDEQGDLVHVASNTSHLGNPQFFLENVASTAEARNEKCEWLVNYMNNPPAPPSEELL